MGGNKVVAIAGASSGTGAALAEYLARHGHAVSLCARREINLHEIRDAITAAGGKAMALKADMSVWEEAERFVQRTVRDFGRIDVLINNAGAGIRYGDFASLSIAEIDEGVTVNLLTVLYGCRAVLPYMIEQGRGQIINMSSVWGKQARKGLAVYSAARHAVEGFSRALFQEVSTYGIKVSILAPGAIDSEWARKCGMDNSERGRWLKPADIAALIGQLIDTPEGVNIWNLDCLSMDQPADSP
jgi:dihydroxycyclohexadiene carboxylate dehydrogenase